MNDTQTPAPTTTTVDDPRPRSGRLTRPRDRRIIAGVGSAIADRSGIDVGIVRLAFAISVFFGGFGIFAYVAAWALIPNEGESQAPLERWFGRPSEA